MFKRKGKYTAEAGKFKSRGSRAAVIIYYKKTLWLTIMLESRIRVSSPAYPRRSPSTECLPFSCVPRYQPSPANPGSQPWRVPRWVMNSRPGVTLFTLTRIVGLAHPCRTQPCHLAFSRDFDTSHSRAVSDTAPRIPSSSGPSESMLFTLTHIPLFWFFFPTILSRIPRFWRGSIGERRICVAIKIQIRIIFFLKISIIVICSKIQKTFRILCCNYYSNVGGIHASRYFS